MSTIRDVAKACGLSAMTVSAVLNNRPGEASAATRQRVLQAVREMGYQPNAIARGLSRKRINTIGIVMAYGEKPSLTADRYLGPVLDGILMAAKREHQRSLIINEDTWDDAGDHLLSYCDGRSDGLIFVLPNLSGETLALLHERKAPFNVIGESRPEAFIPTIDLDNVAAGLLAVDYLLQHGHRRIGYLSGDGFLLSSAQREDGFRQALCAANIPVEEEFIFPGDYSIISGYERGRRLLENPPGKRPTALFCGDDAIALGVLQAARELGVDVPNHLSLVGVNDDIAAASSDPPLTTIHQPYQEIGRRAVQNLMAQVVDGTLTGEHILIPGDLIVRSSVAGVPSA